MPSFLIGEVVKNGILFDLKRWGKETMNAENIPLAVQKLFALLTSRKCQCVLVGGVALLSYIEGRNTQYIDLILSEEDLRKVPEITLVDENKDFAF